MKLSPTDRAELLDALRAVAALLGAWAAVLLIVTVIVTVPTWGEIVDRIGEEPAQAGAYEMRSAERHAEVYRRLSER